MWTCNGSYRSAELGKTIHSTTHRHKIQKIKRGDIIKIKVSLLTSAYTVFNDSRLLPMFCVSYKLYYAYSSKSMDTHSICFTQMYHTIHFSTSWFDHLMYLENHSLSAHMECYQNLHGNPLLTEIKVIKIFVITQSCKYYTNIV